MDELIKRLSRYSEKAIADALDADFARAVQQTIQELKVQSDCIDYLRRTKAEKHNAWLKVSKELKACRNELCLRCGEYKTAHLGSCDGCRWKDGG